MFTALLFILILAILILVHELGHFGVAKLFGVRVDEFGLGFPPRLFSKKYGETTYSLNALPLGGFVKIFGEDSGDGIQNVADKKRSFYYQPKLIQSSILVAGVAMNIIFGYLLISFGFMIGLPAPVDSSAYGKVSNPELIITSVLPQSPAEKAGLVAGDVIVSASSGQNIIKNISPDTVYELISKSQSPITLTYKRGDISKSQTVTITPSQKVIAGQQIIGITMDMVGILKLPVGQAFVYGASTTWQLLKGIAIGLVQFFNQALHFQSNFSQVSGPVGIAKIVGQANAIGFVYLLSLVALISFNLAVINLVPFPALDGGRLFFILIEVITRRKINASFYKWANLISFAFLVILMVIVSVHDIWGIL